MELVASGSTSMMLADEFGTHIYTVLHRYGLACEVCAVRNQNLENCDKSLGEKLVVAS
jgi:hypothetical protein